MITGNDIQVSQVGTIPALPSQDTSVLEPNWAQTNGNQRKLFEAVDAAVSANLAGQSNHRDFYTANHNGNSDQLVDGYYGTQNGTFTGLYSVQTRYTTSYAEYYRNNSRIAYGYPNAVDTYLSKMNDKTPTNLFASQSQALQNMGLMRMATPWQQKTAIPYYLEITTAAPEAHEPDDLSDNWWRYDNYSYMQTYTYYSTARRQAYTKVGATTGNTYSYEFSSTVPGYSSYRWVQINCSMTNRDWYNYQNGNYMDAYWYGNSRYQVHYFNNTRLKQGFHIRLWFLFENSDTWNAQTETKALMDEIVDSVDALFAAKPSFSIGDTVEARAVSYTHLTLPTILLV